MKWKRYQTSADTFPGILDVRILERRLEFTSQKNLNQKVTLDRKWRIEFTSKKNLDQKVTR